MLTSDLLHELRDKSSLQRLRAARALSGTQLSAPDRARIRDALQIESDSWVRSALEGVLTQQAPHDESVSAEMESDELLISDTAAEAIESVTRTIVHEMRSLVADLKLEIEISNSISEAERAEVDRRLIALGGFLDTLTRLNEATSAADFREFDLTTLIQNVTASQSGPFALAREDPVVVLGDAGLLTLAVRNGLRNALEARLPDSAPVVVNWDYINGEAWVSILDDGVGLPNSYARIWEAGQSGKPKDEHFGWGLTITRRAVESLGGTVSLVPRNPRGAKFEVRWKFSGGD